jgi:hypothetical protein
MNTTDRHLVHREKSAQAASLLAEKISTRGSSSPAQKVPALIIGVDRTEARDGAEHCGVRPAWMCPVSHGYNTEKGKNKSLFK